MATFDWKLFEETLEQSAGAALRKLVDKYSQAFYAGAFHEFYAEWNDRISLPSLAANSIEALAEDADSRWSAADWKWSQIPYASGIRKLHRQMEKNATSGDSKHWEMMHERFIQACINVSKELTKSLKNHPRAHPDFVVFVFVEGENDLEVLRKCTTEAKFKKLFSECHAELEQRAKLEQNPIDTKLEEYRRDLRKHSESVEKLGEKAIPMLLEALEDEKQSWCAASILGKIGIADDRVITALRTKARLGKDICVHYTCALALLGDTEFLFDLTKDASARDVAIRGILYPCETDSEYTGRVIPLDYRSVERLLKDPSCKGSVKSLSSARISQICDLEELVRGLSSPHDLIRGHAVLSLGERSLGKKAGERILPALAERLEDRNAEVRRFAVLALSRWKKAARPYETAIRKRFDDPNEKVAQAAKHYVREIS